jgi:hypothetical protein
MSEKRVRRRRVSRDAALVEQIKLAVGELPSYGYPAGLGSIASAA